MAKRAETLHVLTTVGALGAGVAYLAPGESVSAIKQGNVPGYFQGLWHNNKEMPLSSHILVNAGWALPMIASGMLKRKNPGVKAFGRMIRLF